MQWVGADRAVVEMATPGFNTVLQVRLCISRGSPTRGAYAMVTWSNGGGGANDDDRVYT